MTTINYVCLSCGNRFAAVASSLKNKHDNNCPKCKSESVVETATSNMFSFSGGCG